MTKLIITLVLLLVAGCAPVATEFALDPELTPEQTEAAIKSAEYWCKRDPAYCVPVFVGEDSGNGFVTSHPECPDMVAGWTDYWSPVVHLCRNRDHLLQQTVTHEMGHALGLGHSDVKGDIMFPTVEGQL